MLLIGDVVHERTARRSAMVRHRAKQQKAADGKLGNVKTTPGKRRTPGRRGDPMLTEEEEKVEESSEDSETEEQPGPDDIKEVLNIFRPATKVGGMAYMNYKVRIVGSTGDCPSIRGKTKDWDSYVCSKKKKWEEAVQEWRRLSSSSSCSSRSSRSSRTAPVVLFNFGGTVEHLVRDRRQHAEVEFAGAVALRRSERGPRRNVCFCVTCDATIQMRPLVNCTSCPNASCLDCLGFEPAHPYVCSECGGKDRAAAKLALLSRQLEMPRQNWRCFLGSLR
jgi:hypothetical protein